MSTVSPDQPETSPSGAARPIRVVVADDQTAIREALATLLGLFEDIDVVATAADGAAAVDAAARTAPDVVLMDLRMPGTDGVEATRMIGERHPEVAVVVLSTFADEETVLAALGAGARGYVTKDSGRDDIARAIRAAAAGQAVLDRTVQARLIAAVTAPPSPVAPPVPTAPSAAVASQAPAMPARAAGVVGATGAGPQELTPREREVLVLIGEGLSNRAIARELFVSEATVKTHINNLFAKAGLRDRSEAVRYAFTHGLVRPS
ncbi:response regulator transcription factor [Frankia sp. AgB32]|uniref:response regulator transcription factor n=1 Tax=Frankia sp. AgB32 TaxID=631119 RepID=UPI00200FE3DB|nr:response regulator transcription factor [Frankia sp. AgB32]MCK9894805.1 response regulator transcription factor [Frankia sp. AgB32]